MSCPDPAIMEETIAGVENWYLYCTGDPLNSNDKDAQGNLRNHYIATWRSVDLIHWTYNGDVFSADPAWIGVETNLWAPAVKYFNGQYYLYYVAPQTGGPGGPSEIGGGDERARGWAVEGPGAAGGGDRVCAVLHQYEPGGD